MHVAFDPTAAYCRRGLFELDVLACTEGVSACLYTMRRVDRRVLRVGRHAVHVIEGKRRVVQRCSERPPQPNLCRPKCCLNSLGTRKIRARACVSVCGTVNSVRTKRACSLFCTGVSGSKAGRATSKHPEKKFRRNHGNASLIASCAWAAHGRPRRCCLLVRRSPRYSIPNRFGWRRGVPQQQPPLHLYRSSRGMCLQTPLL